ncbi:hypothetical protein GCM10022221_18310 [Actinocorallia aurea]
MPTKGNPRRTLRVSDERWEAVKEKAADQGKTVADVLNDCLDRFLADEDCGDSSSR